MQYFVKKNPDSCAVDRWYNSVSIPPAITCVCSLLLSLHHWVMTSVMSVTLVFIGSDNKTCFFFSNVTDHSKRVPISLDEWDFPQIAAATGKGRVSGTCRLYKKK